MRYYLTLFSRAFRLHLLRESRYRADVVTWLFMMWLTVGTQFVFAYTLYRSANGNFFGYSGREVLGFFGIALFATGVAQCGFIGIVLNLAKAVWQGDFDFWLVQPPPILLRMVIEDLGVVWYWPYVLVGAALLLFSFPVTMWPIAFFSAIVAGVIESGIILILCLPAVAWGRWNPGEGLWEYVEGSRYMPIGRTRNFMLWFVSFGVLHYSLALEVLTGRLSIFLLILIAIALYLIAWLLLKLFLRSYSSASS